ncbi:MAG: AbrB/MazE/SpoVT family DNA-binding domain-containing protein [Acutalibacteraceae bacterium]|nr:AbrB/MazE/SpoVT family DNA-binding domain-containing protein [Acutalibacteraceae bacterium]
MNFTGMLRQVDNLGRIVIPRELRKLLDIKDGEDSFEIYVNDNKEIVLKKYCPACILCGGKENLLRVNEKLICTTCIDKISEFSVK